jgi:hypothetical protein
MQLSVLPLLKHWEQEAASCAARVHRRASARSGLYAAVSVSFALVLLGVSFGIAFGGAWVSDLPAGDDLSVNVEHALDMNSLLINPYIARPTGQRADPINLMFVGTNDASVAANLITNVFGWRENDGGTMYFAQRGEVAGHDRQVASVAEGGRRYHVRLKSGAGTIDGQPFILGAVHMDYNVTCGHVGREFNDARNLVMVELMHRGYEVETRPWGNTETTRHCDSSDTRSDGHVAIIRMEYPAIP